MAATRLNLIWAPVGWAKFIYEQAIKLAADEFGAYLYLGILFRQFGQAGKANETWRKGIEILKRMVDASPQNFRLRLFLIQFYGWLGDRSSVVREETQLLKDAPAKDTGGSSRAYTYAALGDNARAVELLRRALNSGRVPDLPAQKADGSNNSKHHLPTRSFLKTGMKR